MARGSRYRPQYSGVALLLAVIAAHLLTRPYMGFYHDSLLYAAQALRHAGLAALDQDLFFRFGNQGTFVSFPALQGVLAAEIGPTRANWLLTGAAALLWLLGLAMLARTIYPERKRWLTAMMIAVLAGAGYGHAALSYGEGFVTSRPFAEAFGMMALAFALRDETRRGLIAVVLCGVLHPLVGLSVVGIWLVLAFVPSVRLFTLVLLGVFCLVALAQVGIEPASWLMQEHDPEWALLLRKYETLGFMTAWGWLPLRLHALGVVILLLATRSADKLIATVATATLLVAALLVGISLIGADILGNRLIAALQPWRVLSWVTLMGNLMALHLLLSKPPRSAVFVILVIALAVSVTEHLVEVIPIFSTAMAPLVLIAHWTDRPGAVWRWINALLALLATLVVLGIGSFIYIGQGPGQGASLMRIGTALLIGLTFAVRGRENTILLAGAALIAAAVQFDRRTPEMRFIESDTAMPQEITDRLAGETVYWEDGLALMWLKLRQPQFYSCNQRAGTLFYRGQAIEHERRGSLLAPLGTLDFTMWPPGSCPAPADPDAQGPAGPEVVAGVCRAEPALDHLVLHRPVPGLETTRWELPLPGAGQVVHHVACAPFRRPAAESAPPAPVRGVSNSSHLAR